MTEKLYKKIFPTLVNKINLTMVKRSFYRRLSRTKIYKQDNRMNIYLFTYHIISIFIFQRKEDGKKILDDCFSETLFFIENSLTVYSCLIKHYTKLTKHFNFLVRHFSVIYSFVFFVSYNLSIWKAVSFVEVHSDILLTFIIGDIWRKKN